jgi:hypothetical protein
MSYFVRFESNKNSSIYQGKTVAPVLIWDQVFWDLSKPSKFGFLPFMVSLHCVQREMWIFGSLQSDPMALISLCGVYFVRPRGMLGSWPLDNIHWCNSCKMGANQGTRPIIMLSDVASKEVLIPYRYVYCSQLPGASWQ